MRTTHNHAKSIIRAFIAVLLALGAALTAFAQDGAPEPRDGAIDGIAYGADVSGAITDLQPRQVYAFEGLRGDRAEIALDVTSGDLMPIMMLVNSRGDLISSDSNDSELAFRGLRLPENDVYSIIVTRFGGSQGSTSGEYTLALNRLGASAETGSALRYGDNIIGEINPETSTLYYTFQANRGDVITVQMIRLSGDLDTYLQIADSSGRIIAENDEILGSGSLDATIDAALIEDAGEYVIIASRFGGAAGQTSGDFLLSLQPASRSALGSSALMAIPIEPGTPQQGELTDERYAQFYRFDGRRDDRVSIRMARGTQGNLDTLVALTDANLNELVFNDDSGGGQNSLIEDFVLPADGTYYIVATRYQRAQGETAGLYTLQLDNSGSVFTGVRDGALRMSYGSTVAGFIDDLAPETLYVFQGQAGDIITIAMSRSDGNLDPFVTLLDASLNPLAQDDDSAGNQNARIDSYTLPSTGLYYIRAARYNDPGGALPTFGSYLLVLAQRGQ